MDKTEIQEKIYSKIDELPTLPVVIPKLLTLIRDSKSNAGDIIEVISMDPALTSKVLKVANSAYYGFSGKISELEKAVPLLGFNMVQSLAVSLGVIEILPNSKASRYFSPEGLWLHSLTVATIIKELGKKHTNGKDNEYRFIIGLLHDIGKLVFDQYFHEQFQDVLSETGDEEEAKLHIIEQKTIGIDHCEVSAMLLSRWKFPKKITDPIAFLHKKEIPENVNQTDISLLRISNIIAQKLKVGPEGNIDSNPIHEKDFAILNMAEDYFIGIKDKFVNIKEEIRAFYNAMI